MFLRHIRSIMTTTMKKVPIPARGVDYRGKVVLAPMVRSGELPCRLLALHYGADLVWGPETVDRALIGTTRRINPVTKMIEWTRMPSNTAAKQQQQQYSEPNPDHDDEDTSPNGSGESGESGESVIYRLDPVREAGRLIFQLGTSDPARAVAAARLVAPDVAGIDVNAGCPKPFSTSGGMGAALLRAPDKLASILEALVASDLGVGVSVKIRLLETPEETEALVRRLLGTGITALTVHCRTPGMRKRVRAVRGAQLGLVASLCRDAGVACLVNGDVESRDHAALLVAEYGVDGAMIATAAEANPSCFRPGEGEGEGEGGLAPWPELARLYLRFAMEVGNKFGNSKFSLAHLVPGKDLAHRRLAGCKNYAQTCEALGVEEQELLDMARAVDERLGITPEARAAAAAAAAAALADKKKRKRAAVSDQEEEEEEEEGRNKGIRMAMAEKVVPGVSGVSESAASVIDTRPRVSAAAAVAVSL